jgi:hypothetical protein
MKIEPAKNHSAEQRKESKNVFQTETSAFQTSDALKTAAATVPAPQTSSAFSKILEETRKQNEKENSPAAKTDSSEPDSKTAKSERDEKSARVADEQKETKERGEKDGDNDARQNSDENHAPPIALAAPQTATVSDSKAPAARSILHIADLERIVSSIRTETFQNQKQVIIALKNSVLQGLQIKLTLTENGKIKAEFLGLDKQVEKQLNQRKRELSEILKNRSALFSEVAVESQSPDEKK